MLFFYAFPSLSLSAPKKWTVGPRTVGPRVPTVRFLSADSWAPDSWAPDSWAPGLNCPGPNFPLFDVRLSNRAEVLRSECVQPQLKSPSFGPLPWIGMSQQPSCAFRIFLFCQGPRGIPVGIRPLLAVFLFPAHPCPFDDDVPP